MGDLISREALIEALNSNPNIRTMRGGVSGIWINMLDVIWEIRRVPAAELVRRGHWISVQERLPDNLEKCLTFSPENGIRIGCYTEVGFILSNFGGVPTHWMPMPEPPKHDVGGDDT